VVTLLKRKQSLSKDSYGGVVELYETKSNNLTALREEVMLGLHALVGKVDAFQALLVSAKIAFTAKSLHSAEAPQLALHIPQMNRRL
jgi:hypothetical protein